MKPRPHWVYVLTNESTTVLYVGMTSDVGRRVAQHRAGAFPDAFTRRYNVCRLVYVEEHPDAASAFRREREIKGWRRTRKRNLVGAVNPGWDDLLAEADV